MIHAYRNPRAGNLLGHGHCTIAGHSMVKDSRPRTCSPSNSACWGGTEQHSTEKTHNTGMAQPGCAAPHPHLGQHSWLSTARLCPRAALTSLDTASRGTSRARASSSSIPGVPMVVAAVCSAGLCLCCCLHLPSPFYSRGGCVTAKTRRPAKGHPVGYGQPATTLG